MMEGRWDEARAHYLATQRDLSDAHANFLLALLNVSVGARAAGKFPEAAEAAVAAEEFFRSVGAESFLDRYRAAFVPNTPDVEVGPPVRTTERVPTG
jgi:hypothetical protein